MEVAIFPSSPTKLSASGFFYTTSVSKLNSEPMLCLNSILSLTNSLTFVAPLFVLFLLDSTIRHQEEEEWTFHSVIRISIFISFIFVRNIFQSLCILVNFLPFVTTPTSGSSALQCIICIKTEMSHSPINTTFAICTILWIFFEG